MLFADCGKPYNITNGDIIVKGDNTKVNASATVNCSLGYTTKQLELNCTAESGQWEPKNVMCEVKGKKRYISSCT